MSDTIPCVRWKVLSEEPQNGLMTTPWRERDLDELLWQAIRRSNCEDAFRYDFQVTRPLWYGLWMSSPLSRSQCATLSALFDHLATSLPHFQSEFAEFSSALRAAAQSGASVTVELGPPGHVDFGWHTVFPHCPRCKVEAPVERWQQSYPETPLNCPVCGFNYSPASTHFAEREFWSRCVECGQCHRRFAVREFTETDRDLLEEQAALMEMLEELKWLDRVGEFYKRYPEQKSAIEPDILRYLRSSDPSISEQLAAGVPFNELFPPAESAAEGRAWSAEDRAVLDYLKHNQFDCDARESFVRQRVQSGSNTLLDRRVSCRDCGGRIEVIGR